MNWLGAQDADVCQAPTAPATDATTMNNDYVLVSTDQILKRKKNLLWAQTTPDALFGLFSSLLSILLFKILTTSKFIS